MENIILIKYGELTTKKDNRNQFINILYNNLNEKIKKYDAKIIKEHARMYIICNEHTNEILDIVSNTFGIHAFNICYKTHTNTEDIKSLTLELLKQKNFKTFKVETKRRDKNFPIKSMDFNHIIGSHILKNINDIKVEVENPEILVHIEINKEDTYIYFNDIKGLGGYPVGVQQKGLLMLSGGIDSPVAGYLALKRGIKIDAIYFEAIPHTSLNAREKVKTLAKELLKYTTDINLYVVPITKLQEEIYKNCDSTYIITILRRMMYRISEQLANKNNQLVLINGESIGQVASQTLNSMRVINEVVKIPVIRPVACLDKLEIIEIAKKINTYETSILPYEDCCTIFVPRHPVINPKHEKCLKEEQKIDYEQLIKESIDNTMIINIKEEEQFSDIL
jgi:tRNA uracil 4-sulfurtransferase